MPGTGEAFLAGLPGASAIPARQFGSFINTPAPFYLLIGERPPSPCLAHCPVSLGLDGTFTGRVRRWWILGRSRSRLADAGAALYPSEVVSVVVAQGWAFVTVVALTVGPNVCVPTALLARGAQTS